MTQKRLTNIILVSPRPEAFPEDEIHTFQRVRCPCRTALVISKQTARHAIGRKNRPIVGMLVCFNRRIPAS